jgi:hypothetical protein
VSLEVSFADAEAGVFGFCEIGPRFDGGAPISALFRDGEETGGGEFEASPDGDAAVKVEGDGWGFELEHSSRGEPVSFGPDTEAGAVSAVTLELGAAGITGRVWDAKGERRIRCPGLTRSATGAVDWGQASLLRILAVPFEGGGLLALAGARPARAEGHGEEGVTAVLRDSDGAPARAEEALLSTQYDREGDHVRAGLELQLPAPEDEERPPLRGAGTRLCGTRLGQAVAAAFFRWELEGRKGVGRYDIVRRG